MRLLPYPRLGQWHARGRLPGLRRLLLRGDLLIRGGLATRARLPAEHFDPFGAQAFNFLTGTHEPMVQEALRRTVGEAGTVYDIGANLGFSTLVAARLAGPRGRVVAFDPQSECAAAVAAAAARNPGAAVTVIEAAVGARSGSAELIVVTDALWTRLAAVGDHSLERQRRDVRLVAIDDLVAAGEAPPPDVVKIDVEGAELEVVAGMRRVLSEFRPVLICEMHGRNREFVELMDAAGYRTVNLEGPEPAASAGGNIHVLCEPRG